MESIGGVVFASESEIESRSSIDRKQKVAAMNQMAGNIDPHPSHLTDTSINSRNHQIRDEMKRPEPRYSNFLIHPKRESRGSANFDE